MKICIVTDTFPPEINGVAKTLCQISQDLKVLGHFVTIICPQQRGAISLSTSPHITMVPSLPIPFYRGLRFGLPCRTLLKKIWRTEKPDVVYIATEGLLALSAISIASKMKIAITSGFHTNFHKYMHHYRLPMMAKFIENFLKKTHNKTLRTFAPTEDVIQQLNQMGVNNPRLLSRGVDTELFNPSKRNYALRKSWGITSDDQYVALFVSRIAAEKNIPLAIKAFKKIKDASPNTTCIFVGDGPEKLRLQKKYPEFKFVGMQTGEKLSEYYASGDLFLFPSLTETFGNVIPEAMASSLIPIAFNYAAPKALIENNFNGYLADYNDSNSFLETIDRALGKKNEWSKIRLNARQTVEKLNWKNIVKSFAQELNQAYLENISYESNR
ncbi:MAG: glycosyltransferase family 1 protein [Opitutae bacterium]|nr:glycosyltransferase family 1 protein [Opitutae bacterium]